jgi:hypothetical protein
MRIKFWRALAAFGAGVFSFCANASASYHTFRFAEIYSNASGTVQFIELHESFGADGQNLLGLAPDIFAGGSGNIGNSAHDLTLTNLSSSSTANTYVLLGTAGYNALPGAPHADFLIPNNFFNPNGDTLQYGQGAGNPSPGPDGVVDLITFGAVPSNSSQALQRQGLSGSTFTTGPAIANTFNNGGNFAVPEPASFGLLLPVIVFVMRRRRSLVSL